MAETDVVVHDPDRSRYVLKRGDRIIGETFYDRGPRGEIIFTHTVVDDTLNERGLGSQLARGVLDDVRATSDARVVAKCPFVYRFIATHPEYKDLTKR
jgi:predicted GNAT family acetyltransferase